MSRQEEMREFISEFKKLTAKVQQENTTLKKILSDQEKILEACQKEYEKLFFPHEELKK